MTFPDSIANFEHKDTTSDEVISPQFYANGVDFNGLFDELLGIQNQLGATKKLDILCSGNTIFVAGPSQATIGGLVISIAAQNVAFAGPGVTFVWIDDSGLIQSGVALPVAPVNHIPIAQVTHGAGGAISACLDLRPWITGTGGGGGGGGFPANFRCTTSDRLYTRRDIVAVAATDFLPLGFKPVSDSAEWIIELVSDTDVEVKLIQIEGAIRTEYILGNATAGVLFRKWPILAPERYDGGGTDIEYQLQVDVAATLEYVAIAEIEFDALCNSETGTATKELIPFCIPFTYASGSPVALFITSAGDVLTECEVVIETEFDDPAATLQVGVLGDLGAVLPASTIAPTIASQYATMADRTSAVVEAYLLTISAGVSTAGSGYVAGVIRR